MEPRIQYKKTSNRVNIAFASMGAGPLLIRVLAATTILALAIVAASGIGDPASAGSNILVTSVLHPGAGGCTVSECTLHEAITDANANPGQDTITFDPGVFPAGNAATISTAVTALPASDDPDGLVIDGTGAGVIIDGIDLAGGEVGLVFHSAGGGVDLTGVVVRSLTVQNFPGFGILVCGGPIVVFECDEDLSGTELSNVNLTGNGDHGIEIRGTNVSNTTLADCSSSNNAGAGIRVRAFQQLDFTSVSTCSSEDNGEQGIQLRGATGTSNTMVSDVTVTGNNNDGIWVRSLGDITDTTVDGSTAVDNNSGIHLDAGGQTVDATLTNNVATKNNRGIRLEGDAGITNVSVESNTLTSNTTGIEVEGTAGVHFNRIVGNTVGVMQSGVGVVDAEDNWWGCNTGPNTPGCDTIVGNIDGNPWLVLDLTTDPVSIPTLATSTLTADVTGNSNGADTSGEGNIPNGTSVMFTTDLGDVGSKQVAKQTTDGSAEAMLTADEGPGTANVTATLDNETLVETVEITTATATPTTTPSPAPAGQQVTWADNNCKDGVNPVDSLFVLRGDAGVPTNTGDCPDMGQDIEVLNASPHIWGDVDCNGSMTPVDSLKILRYDAGLGASQDEGCPGMGTSVTIAEG